MTRGGPGSRVVAVTQRVVVDLLTGERRDCLDQSWTRFLLACGLLCVPTPNHAAAALDLCHRAPISGVLLTGGNDLASCGGDAPERDDTELALVEWAVSRSLPVLGVCRGMQVLQRRHGVALRRVDGHVASRQTITVDGDQRSVNSYHRFGATYSVWPLDVFAVAADGVVKGVRDVQHRSVGLMWHPERMTPFALPDIELFRRHFGA